MQNMAKTGDDHKKATGLKDDIKTKEWIFFAMAAVFVLTVILVSIYDTTKSSPMESIQEEQTSYRQYYSGYTEPNGIPADASLPPLDLNAATQGELMTLPGIGEVMAQRILLYREQCGGLDSVEDLLQVEGIGQATLEALRPYVTVKNKRN